MKITYDKKFLKSVKKLPLQEQHKLEILFNFLGENIFHPRLHTKQLSTPLNGFYSFRLSREYRVLFRIIDEDTVFLVSAKHRKEIYR